MKTNWGLCPIPSSAFNSLLSEFEGLFNSYLAKPTLYRRGSYPYNIYASKDDLGNITKHTIEVALAGIPKDKVSVKVIPAKASNYLCISVDNSNQDKEMITKQTSNASYKVEFALSDSHDIDNVSSQLKDGLLSVTVPLKQEVEKPPIEITIG